MQTFVKNKNRKILTRREDLKLGRRGGIVIDFSHLHIQYISFK
jgi:hypothetical protein